MRSRAVPDDFHALLIDFEFFAYSVQLANALSQLCRVTLMLPERVSEQCKEATDSRVCLRLFRMPRLRYPSNLFMVASLLRTINLLRPQVVHQQAWNLWMDLALPLFPKIPYVATIHDAKRHPGDRASFLLFQSQQYQRADRVIVHSEAIRCQLVESCGVPEEKIQTIPLGATQSGRYWGETKEEEQAHTILFFGRIWDYKGLQYLIEAEPLISQQVPDVHILIAGVGEPFEKYERMMVHRGRFTVYNQYIPDDMAARLFREASVIVLPYIEASQSGVIPVAYSFGKPVVATTVGGIPEMVQDGATGYLVPPRDVPSLARAIVDLLKNVDLREKMGRNALAKAQAELSFTTIANRTYQAYQAACKAFSARH